MASLPVSDVDNVMNSNEQEFAPAHFPLMSPPGPDLRPDLMRPSALHKSPFAMVPPIMATPPSEPYLHGTPSEHYLSSTGPGPGPSSGPPMPLPPGLAHLLPLQPSTPNVISPPGALLQPHVLPPPVPPVRPLAEPALGAPHRPQSQTYDVPAFVYDVGFSHAMWTDTTLTVGSHSKFYLHALFASRCRKLNENLCLKNRKKPPGPPYKIQLECADTLPSPLGLSMVLSTLYGRRVDISTLNVATAKSLVASASLLEMDDVAGLGVTALLQMLSPDTAMEILDFALLSTIKEGEPPMSRDVCVTHPGPYPRATASLVQAVLDWIARDLKPTSRKDLHPAYQAILTSLPFPLYKYLVEHMDLRVEGVMQRHFFAREATKSRELARKANYPDFAVSHEESVVLTFGSERDSRVEVIRKPISRRKSFWKAHAP